MKLSVLLMAIIAPCVAGAAGTITSVRAERDFTLTADPEADMWKGVRGVWVENDTFGKPVPGHRTEVRSRWTDKFVYFLFICPYQELHLKPDPQTATDTNRLWEWDVAEVFVGSDFKEIHRYKEFELSPQGEWIDLDIDSRKLNADENLKWNSGFEVKARIDARRKVWYGEMKIPIRSIDPRPPQRGNQWRINFYRAQGKPPARVYLAWQPTRSRSFHVPEAFGTLVLGE
jgi:hypothetical protein